MKKGDVIIGLSAGGTKCSANAAEYDGKGRFKPLFSHTFPTLGRGWREVFGDFDSAIDKFGASPSAIGVISGGPLDGDSGRIFSPPNLIGWDNVPAAKYFSDKYGVSAVLMNDADAGALAEWRFGAGRGYKNMIYLTFGTGMGAGLILDGRLYTGACNAAGEIGHVRLARKGVVGYGKSGSAESFVSGAGIARAAKETAKRLIGSGKRCSFARNLSEAENVTAKDVAESAAAGNADAVAIMRKTGEKLGEILAVLTDILNPQLIVIGGIYVRNESLLSGYALSAYKREALARSRETCTVSAAELGEKIDFYASVSAVVYGCRTD